MTNSTPKGLAALEGMLNGSLPGTRPDLEQDAQRLAEQMEPLLDSLPEVDPPEGLFAAIEAEIDSLEDATVKTIRADEGDWIDCGDKVWMKVLAHDMATGRKTFLLRCLPGARIKAHRHERAEHLYVIEGELWVGDVLYSVGDAQIAMPGSAHAEATMPAGCLVLVST